MIQEQLEDFAMPTLQDKPPDQQRIVAALARECLIPVGEMATLYAHERAELAVDAHIVKYLDIFATRKVLEVLRQRRLDQPIPASVMPARPVA